MTQTADSKRWPSASRLRLRLRRLVDRLLASDPGLQRLRAATRVTLSTVMAALVSYLLVVMLAGGFVLSPLFGAFVALMATNAVRDGTVGERKVTTLLLFFPASAAVAAAALLSSTLWAQWLALSVVVFFAFYLRRFGPRYVAMGFMAAIPFFVSAIISSLLGFPDSQLPWIFAAIALGLVCVYGSRFYLLPDNPRSVLRRSLSAFDVQLGLTLEAITRTLSDRRHDGDRDRRLRRDSSRLRERASAAEGQLLAEETDVSREDSDRLRLRLFDSEMSTHTLWEIVWNDVTSSEDTFPEEVRDPLLRALYELCATLRLEGAGSHEAPGALRNLEDARAKFATEDRDAGWSFQVRRADAAIRQLSEGAGEEEETGPASAESDEKEPEEDSEGEECGEGEEQQGTRRSGIAGRLRPTTIQGIQATVAVGLALLAGEVFSSSRPYWVVIVAFIVFVGSGTLGDTLSRGFQRTVGTLAGAVAGFLLASLVSGNLYLEGALIVACIFLAFYLFSISQTLMMFWITVLLALAFDIIGRLGGGGILALRFFDTLLGSAIGLAIAALVFPTKPSDEFRSLTTDFLHSLQDYVGDQVKRLSGDEASRHPVEQAREVEGKLGMAVQNAVTTRRQAGVFGRTRTTLNHWMTGLLALDYYARHLAGPVGRRQRLDRGTDQSELLREAGDRISANIGSLRRAISKGEECSIQDIEGLMQQLENRLTEDQRIRKGADDASGSDSFPDAFVGSAGVSPTPEQASSLDALHYLRRINRTLGELSAAPAIGGGKKSRVEP